MCSDNFLLEEYRFLRNEIAKGFATNLSVMISNFSFMGICVGYGMNNPNVYIFLAPLFLFIPCVFFLASEENSITRIASYVAVFHEGKELGISWEKNLFNARSNQESPMNKRLHSMSLIMFYGLFGFLSIFISGYFFLKDNSINPAVFTWLIYIGSCFLILGILDLRRAFSTKTFSEYLKYWKTLR